MPDIGAPSPAHAPKEAARRARVQPEPTLPAAAHPQQIVNPTTAGEVLWLQRTVGNRATSGILRAPGAVIQRTLAADRLQRLETHLGTAKYGKVTRADALEIFDRLSDAQLDTYQHMDDHAFDSVMKKIGRSGLGALIENVTFLTQFADYAGAALETGEASAAMLQQLDAWLEGVGGGVGGLKDLFEGFKSYKVAPKTAALTLVSGASSVAGLFGVPEFVGMAAGGAKAAAGVGKAANTWSIRSEINRLKAETGCTPQLTDALDMLYNEVGYGSGLLQGAQGLMEGGGSLFGTWGKWGGQMVSKSLDLGPMAFRFFGSWAAPGKISSNREAWAQEKAEKKDNRDKIQAAVMSGISMKLAAMLYKVCQQVEDAYASEVMRCVDVLGTRADFDSELARLK